MDLASLQLEIDSRKVQQAQKDLEGLAAAAEKTEAATDSLTQANKQSEDRYKAIARAAIERQQALNEEVRAQMASNNVTRQASEGAAERARAYTRVASAEHQARLENERQAAAMKAAAEAAERNQASLQKLLNQIDPLQGKLNRLDEMERQLTQTFRQGALDAETYAVSLAKIAGQRAAIGDQQLKQVAAGAKDAAGNMERLGLHTSQAHADLLSLGRAASSGDLSGASGSIMRLSRSTGIMSSAFSLAGISVLGLAAGVGALVAAYHQGQGEAEGYNRAIIMTGNSAGVTSNDLAEMAARIGETEGGTRKAAQALTLFVGAGKIAKENLEAATKAAIAMSDATGKSVQDFIADFELIARDPVKAIETLHEKYGMLSIATRAQAQALVDQGREQEAVALVSQRASGEMEQIAGKLTGNLNAIERAWQGVSKWASEAWSNMLNIGRARTGEEVATHIEQLQAQLARVDESISNSQTHPMALASIKGEREKLVSTLHDLLIQQETILHEAGAAYEEGRKKNTESQALAARSSLDAWLRRADVDRDKAEKIAEIRAATKKVIDGYEQSDALPDAMRTSLVKKAKEDEQLLLAHIEKQFKPQTGKQADTSEYRRTLQSLTDDFRSANQVLDSERRANLVDEESYWKRKVELIDENERVQTAAMQSELARLAGVKNSTKQRADIEAQLAKVSKEAAKERQVAANQQIEAHNKTRLAVEAYIEALQSLVRAEEQAGRQRIAGMGLGPRERELQDTLSRVDLDFANKQIRLSQDQSKMSPGEYQQKLDGLISAHQGMRNQIIQNYHAIKEAESEWLRGAAEGAMAYADDAANVYKNLGQAVSGAFKGMEDALTSFVTTGKMDFKSLADSIIKDMVRIAIQQSITGPLAGALGGLFGAGLNIGGGAVSAMPGMSMSTSLGSMSNFTAIPFADGGFTGPGGRYEPAGIVHKGEGVLNQDEIRALGGEPGFNLLRRALRGPGHAIGGMGGRPSLPSAALAGEVPNINVNIQGGPQQAEVSARRNQQGDIDINIIYKQIENRIAGGVASGQGAVGRAVERRYGLTPKLG